MGTARSVTLLLMSLPKLARLRHRFVIRSLFCIAASAMFSAGGALAADDSAIKTQDSVTPSSTGSAVKKKVHSHLMHIGQLWKSPEYDLSSTSDPKARCRKSKLTQESFLEMVHAIVKHGDLTDKAFIEKLLQTNFGPAVKAFAYSHIPGGGFYNGDMPSDIRDAPIKVSLDIGTVLLNEDGKRELYAGVGFNDLNRVGAVFHNCQYLTRKQLDPKAEGIILQPTKKQFDPKSTKAITNKAKERSAAATWDLGNVGKKGADIKIFYLFSTDDRNAIESVTISHQSETHLNPIGGDNAEYR